MADDDVIADRRVWVACNPAYPARISMAYMEREFAALGAERFARERLGKSEWPSGDPDQWEIVTEDAWMACYAPGASLGDPPALVPPGPVSPGWESWPGGIPPWIGRAGLCRSTIYVWPIRTRLLRLAVRSSPRGGVLRVPGSSPAQRTS
jgi:hypothetical protein